MKEKLKKLISLCKGSIQITINGHQDFYQTVQDYVEELAGDFTIDKEMVQQIIQADTIVEFHFYPDTLLSFIFIAHYDLEQGLDLALKYFTERN